jgi:hypothetical protein
MRGVGRWIALALSACAVSSCSIGGIQHNDVLIFGTDTKLALDVSTSPTSGGAGEVTIGYKRQEAVWMPLIVNGRGFNAGFLKPLCLVRTTAPGPDGKPGPAKEELVACGPTDPKQTMACVDAAGQIGACVGGPTASRQVCRNGAGAVAICTPVSSENEADLTPRKYVGEAEARDGKPVGRDAYSVFASFGADIKGDAKGTGSVGLAQFFATGIAAQRLASNSQVANALSVQPPETGVAMAEASAGLSPELQAAVAAAQPVIVKNAKNATVLAACATVKASSSTKLSSLLPASPADPAVASLYPGFKADLDKARTEAQFTSLVARQRPDFEPELHSLITQCGGTPA